MAFSIALIIILGLLSESVLKKVGIPGLVGMLFCGMLLGPHALNIIKPELLAVSADFRMFALAVILLRAGLKTRKEAVNRVGRVSVVMGFLPSTMEGVAIAFAAPYLLQISYREAVLLGFVVAAVSPAVIVPAMIDFADKKIGTLKGIPSMLLASSSLDNAYVIVVFSALLGIHVGAAKGLSWLFAIPQSILLGVAVGLGSGYILWRVFEHYSVRATKMTLAILAVALLLIWLEELVKPYIVMSSLLAIMGTGFILLEKAEERAHKVSAKLSKVWIFAEIILFVLVGAQVDIDLALKTGLAGVLLIGTGLVVRSIGTFISVSGTALSSGEKLFCIISYIPKATVQAAIGAVPLEAGIKGGDIILAVAVLSIIVTAPLGAMGIQFSGRNLLARE